MWMRYRCLAVFFCVCLFALSSSAAEKSDPKAEAVLQQARELGDLHQAGTASFRLQASFETYDYKGVPDGKGVMSETYVQDGLWQRSILYRDKHSMVTSVDGKVREVSDSDYQTTFAMTRTMEALFAPVPAAGQLSKYSYKLTSVKAGTVSLQCVVASLPYEGERASSAPNAAYCMDADPAVVRLVEGHNGLRFTFNRMRRFGSVYVPGEITMMEKGLLRAHIRVDGIVAVPSLKADDVHLPPADAGGAKVVDGRTIDITAIRKTAPKYPDEAKLHRIQGTVVLHAIIGKDGTIRDLELISAPDDSLVESAMVAARQWAYTPYLVNGMATEVDTNITINYAMRF